MQSFKGRVVKGRGLGTQLGFPTANVVYDGDLRGVFAGRVLVEGKWCPAAVHVGNKPTLDDHATVCEAHILDFSGVVEGEIEVELVERIRDVQKFPDLAELKKQIASDVESARMILC